MIDRRYFAIIYLVLSSLTIQSSFATEIEYSPNSDSQQLIFEREDSDRLRWQSKPLLAREATSQANRQQPEKISKQWSLIGILVTLILFLFILKVLFKKETLGEGKDRQTASVSFKASDSVNKEKSSQELNRAIIVRDCYRNSNYRSLNNAQFQLRKKNSSHKITKDVVNPKKSTVDSNITGKLTIVADDTTEIDVVSELIRDLQQNNQTKNEETQKNLRRKAIWELGQVNDFRAVEPLVQTIPVADSLEKSLILDAITQITQRNFTTINSVLLNSLSDDNVQMKNNAIRDLTNLYKSMYSIAVRLSKMTSDGDREVRQTATQALKKLDRISDAAIQNSEITNLDVAVDRSQEKSHY